MKKFLNVVALTFAMTSLLALGSCTKDKQAALSSSHHGNARLTAGDYYAMRDAAAANHNDYLDFMYDNYAQQRLSITKNSVNFAATESADSSYFVTRQIGSSSTWHSMGDFNRDWYSSNQSFPTYNTLYLQTHGSPAFQAYANQVMSIVDSNNVAFINQSNAILNNAIAGMDLTDTELEGLASAIGAAQGSFSYWNNSTNFQKWVDENGSSSCCWGNFWAADAGGAFGGACAGAVLGGVGAGPGAVCGAAFCSGCVALCW